MSHSERYGPAGVLSLVGHFAFGGAKPGCLIAKYPCSDEAGIVEVVYADLVGVGFGGNCGRDFVGNSLVAEWHPYARCT